MTHNPIESHASKDLVAEHFRRSCETLSRAANDPKFRDVIHVIAATITVALREGKKLLVAGNGGSAADAQHIAGEFLSRLNFDRNPLPAIALTTDSSVLTAIGNDYGFEHVFERQVQGLGKPGDVFIAISTSGRSPNVIAALKSAREAGLTVIMDRCPKIEYGRLSGEIGWMGVNRRVIDNRKPLLFQKGGSLRRT